MTSVWEQLCYLLKNANIEELSICYVLYYIVIVKDGVRDPKEAHKVRSLSSAASISPILIKLAVAVQYPKPAAPD